jgi:hypothetical protein
MKLRRIHLYVLLALLTFNCGPCSTDTTVTSSSTAGGPGFDVAYFGKDALEYFMAREGCDALRFYNIRRSDTDDEGSAMVIPAQYTGPDLYIADKQLYVYYDGLRESEVVTGRFTEAEAERATDRVEAAMDSTYASNFALEEISRLLEVHGCNALEARPERRADGYYTFRLTPVTIIEGRASAAGDGTVYAVCGDPCPVYCGHMPTLYVHMRP